MARKARPEKTIYTREYAAVLRLLRETREESGITQVELAERLGQTQSFVSKAERGERRIDIIQLRTILREIGMTLPDFATRLEARIRNRA